jgi:TRAP-type C4-dicarboxylate transport system substrate-binding protein
MRRGVIDGAVMVPYMMKIYRIHEVTKFTLKFHMGCALAENMMNKNSWERLPDDLKPIVEAAGRMAAQSKYISGDYTEMKEMAAVAKAGPVYVLPAQEEARWSKAMKPVVDRWVADMEAKGLPAREVVSIFREECTKRGVAWPY